MNHDIRGLEKKLHGIKNGLAALGSHNVADELISIIHRPGWTTPAEFLLVSAMAESLQRQLDTARAHYNQLVEAAGRVGKT
jgi:hypothetical protein